MSYNWTLSRLFIKYISSYPLNVSLKKEILRMDEGGRRFARLVKAGDFLFVAGTTGQDVDGAKGNIRLQARRIFEKIKLVLEQNSSSLENVVSMTTYLTNFNRSMYSLFAISSYLTNSRRNVFRGSSSNKNNRNKPSAGFKQ